MATLNFTQEGEANQPNSRPWPIVGKAWPTRNGKGYSIVVGNRVRSERGNPQSELREAFEDLKLKPGDRLVLQENQYKNDAEGANKQPTHIVKLAPEEDSQ